MDRFLRTAGHVWDLFFGTYERTRRTLIAIVVIWAVTHPGMIAGMIGALLAAILNAIAPLVPQILTLAIMAFGASLLFRNVFGRGGKKKSSS